MERICQSRCPVTYCKWNSESCLVNYYKFWFLIGNVISLSALYSWSLALRWVDLDHGRNLNHDLFLKERELPKETGVCERAQAILKRTHEIVRVRWENMQCVTAVDRVPLQVHGRDVWKLMIRTSHNRGYLLQENPGNVAEKGKDRVLEVNLTLSLMVKHLPRRTARNLTEDGWWNIHDLVQDQSHPLKSQGQGTHNHGIHWHETRAHEIHGQDREAYSHTTHNYETHVVRSNYLSRTRRSSRSPQMQHTARSRNSSTSTAHPETNPKESLPHSNDDTKKEIEDLECRIVADKKRLLKLFYAKRKDGSGSVCWW